MATNITDISFDRPVIEGDGSLTSQSRTFFNTLKTRVLEQSLVVGTGSPEGVVEADVGTSYMDDAGVAGAISYIKRDADILGDKSMGWVLV